MGTDWFSVARNVFVQKTEQILKPNECHDADRSSGNKQHPS